VLNLPLLIAFSAAVGLPDAQDSRGRDRLARSSHCRVACSCQELAIGCGKGRGAIRDQVLNDFLDVAVGSSLTRFCRNP
jgi:hypothetical protein